MIPWATGPTARHQRVERLVASVTNSFTTNDWLKTDAYDNNGNTLWSTNGTVQGPYYYDVENRLTNYGNNVYLTYNGDGSRVKKTQPPERLHFTLWTTRNRADMRKCWRNGWTMAT